jgi:hypothetical protein
MYYFNINHIIWTPKQVSFVKFSDSWETKSPGFLLSVSGSHFDVNDQPLGDVLWFVSLRKIKSFMQPATAVV